MRILIKGGVWKNTEDEILKAAVMKYGLNQWARISSLLVRKSAKQCKARWYEWLDPAIKKTEWTRDEDEKLLHLAKLMPTQWRTIAPIVGRTPNQCLERYEKLLDMAAGNKEDGYEAGDDPRRLRPGEIDPAPETKPARPDPIDMDEDEKEMLSEARARLANTKGKKAKRKAREKQLEEARRLAALQKKRELKAAGIEVREKVRRGQGVDYSREVPFERRPAPGFYDVSEENKLTRELREEFRPVTKEELEGKKRKDIEAELVKRDMQRQKMAERRNAPATIAHALAANAVDETVRPRGKMMLPAPQISDAELEMIARQGGGGPQPMDLIEGGSEVTRGLIGDYASDTPARLATPLATPANFGAEGALKPGSRAAIMQEAQNLARLQQGMTPLLGGENPDLHPSDFTGAVPKHHRMQTPGPDGTTPLVGGRSLAGVAATPNVSLSKFANHTSQRGGGGGGGTGGGADVVPTPVRDALGLNPDARWVEDAIKEGSTSVVDKDHRKMEEIRLRASLADLPAPQNEYQIALDEVTQGDDGKGGKYDDDGEGEEEIEDAAERDARAVRKAQEERQRNLQRRSSVLKRKLPRPVTDGGLRKPRPDDELHQLNPEHLAEELVHKELLKLVQHDDAQYPQDQPEDGNAKMPTPIELEFEAEELSRAAEMVMSEIQVVREAMGHADVSMDEYMTVADEIVNDVVFLPEQGKFIRSAGLKPAERVAALKHEFESVRKEMEREAKRARKLENKLNVLLGGLTQRHDRLLDEISSVGQGLSHAAISLNCFLTLHESEQRAAPERIEALQELVNAQVAREAGLQERYRQAVWGGGNGVAATNTM